MPIHIHQHLVALDRVASGEAVEAQIWILGIVYFNEMIKSSGFTDWPTIRSSLQNLTQFLNLSDSSSFASSGMGPTPRSLLPGLA